MLADTRGIGKGIGLDSECGGGVDSAGFTHSTSAKDIPAYHAVANDHVIIRSEAMASASVAALALALVLLPGVWDTVTAAIVLSAFPPMTSLFTP